MAKGYVLGTHANRPELPPLQWAPDAKDTVNPHMLITGGSGSGKTRLMLNIVSHLAEEKKHIHMFDLKGDIVVKDKFGNKIGNYIEFTAWDSPYGINPFEFDTGVIKEKLEEYIKRGSVADVDISKIRNSGPKIQVNNFVEIIKKNYLPNMGPAQKDVLVYLFSDTYSSRGFKFNDINTWTKELPSLDDTVELIERVKQYFNNPDAIDMDEESEEYVAEAKNKILQIKAYMAREKDETANDADKEEAQKKIKLLQKEMQEDLDSYTKYGIENFTKNSLSSNRKWFKDRNIDVEKHYGTKDSFRTMVKLSSYINALVASGVFHSVRPPLVNGLNIINISGLDVSIQRFVVDIWLGRVFKSCKIRGEYSERQNKSRGAKFDTVIVIDESKLISGNSKEKNDPYSYLNRIATEARSSGLSLICASQSAAHFPPEFLKNFENQILLKTSVADSEAVRKFFGIDKNLLEYTQGGFGKALVKTGCQFSKVKLSA